MKTKDLAKRFWVEEDGMETLEWAILGGVIIVAAAVASIGFGGTISSIFGKMKGEVDEADGYGS